MSKIIKPLDLLLDEISACTICKDSLAHSVFGIDAEIEPVAGSTSEVEIYPLHPSGAANLINFPGGILNKGLF